MEKDEYASAAIKGDETALLQRIEMDKQQLYAIAYSYMRNEDDALEAVQETVCRVWVKRRTLREPQFFSTWMIRILIRVCLDARKKRQREWPLERDIGRRERLGQADDAAERLDIAAQVQLLPPKYRMVVTLKYYRDMTITDIAKLLEKPEGTIRTWLNKALKTLRADATMLEGGERNDGWRGSEYGTKRT
ncbi:sigma-70 family RNA polymerase sigma factor [Paenibacillus arenilitoris]|uniref:Sigma-70 family RNA polymerase sigma factor n=1 Tax=Paenibacillus arenilitoris TaxID=2772299 RepID=A0A927CS60_9BACL|nr:sigma-70 family RNA polymerase sigma factor [Paenibacillus arenilitoris]MBD2872622.1 sigma-70 family RNA polymerase sigma factor [Paenibacillus arenilitoris]